MAISKRFPERERAEWKEKKGGIEKREDGGTKKKLGIVMLVCALQFFRPSRLFLFCLLFFLSQKFSITVKSKENG